MASTLCRRNPNLWQLADSTGHLGDIDLAVKLLRRYPNNYHLLLTERLIERNQFRGTFFQRLSYDERSAYQQLKNRDWRISVQPFHVLETSSPRKDDLQCGNRRTWQPKSHDLRYATKI